MSPQQSLEFFPPEPAFPRGRLKLPPLLRIFIDDDQFCPRTRNAAPGNDLPVHLETEARALNLARFGPEASEGLTAFLEKRPARFRDAN